MRLNAFFLQLLWVLLASSPPLAAAVFKQAEVTRVLNDVRVLPDQAAPATARIGDVINGKTAVATGTQSRAELRFPDKTLTRLGANTLFRLEEGTRDIDLERGVLLLQVPKQLGGARVRTAAVTAAVTGTTILFEYLPDGYIKVIVIEGELDLYMRNSPSNFINLKAGDMILMKPDAKNFPQPVKVDLERLLATSKLFDANEFGPIGNNRQIADALSEQDKKKNEGELMKTAFMLPGRGTKVALTNEVRRELLRFETGGSGAGGPTVMTTHAGDETSGAGQSTEPRSPIIRPYNPGTTVITDEDPIATNPSLTAYNSLADDRVTAFGFFYHAQADGAHGQVLFGQKGTAETNSLVRAAGLWAVFHFEDLVINGNPIVHSVSGARNLLLASGAGILLQGYDYYGGMDETFDSGAPYGSGSLTVDSSLDTFMLASNLGSIVIDGNFRLNASGAQNIILQTFGPQADIIINGFLGEYEPVHINAPDGKFHADAGRDVQFNTAAIRADEIHLRAKRDVVLDQYSSVRARSAITVKALRDIHVSNSSELAELTEGFSPDILLSAGRDLAVNESHISGGNVTLESRTGNLLVANSYVSGDAIRARTLAPNGQLNIDGATFQATSLLRLYAEGSNGHIRFVSDSTLAGNRVDIAAKTVTINPGVSVEVSNPSGLRVYTQNANYNRPSAPNSNGRFANDGVTLDVTPQPFGNRPGFNAP